MSKLQPRTASNSKADIFQRTPISYSSERLPSRGCRRTPQWLRTWKRRSHSGCLSGPSGCASNHALRTLSNRRLCDRNAGADVYNDWTPSWVETPPYLRADTQSLKRNGKVVLSGGTMRQRRYSSSDGGGKQPASHNVLHELSSVHMQDYSNDRVRRVEMWESVWG